MDLTQYMAKPDKTIEEHNQDLLKQAAILKEYHYIEDDKLYSLLQKACAYHDLGKVNSQFQQRVKAKGKKIRFDEEKEVPHNILSMYFVDKNEFESEEEYYEILFAVGYHHNYGSVYEIIEKKKELIKDLLAPYEIKTKPENRRIRNRIYDIQKEKDAILLKGLLHKCDYSASGNCCIEYPNNFLEQKLNQLLETWKSNTLFHSKKVEWNALQHFCMEHQDENIIAIAETGMGKTEAALLWSGNHKVVFILPIKTAINAMYERIRDVILGHECIDERLGLLHSETLEYCMKQQEEEWNLLEYNTRCKQLAMPITISTLDQLFDFVFKYQGYELKLATLSYSKLIIDEIQMYGPDLLAYLVAGLEKIFTMGGKIAIVTATLPPFVRDLLVEKIPFKIGTFTNEEQNRHHVKLMEDYINSNDIFDLYTQNKKLGTFNKILVVCNTVKEAQKLYKELEELLQESCKELHILHSRFTKQDRSRLEKEITEVGRTYSVESTDLDFRNEIWISTSLVEASLDIDFDYLFTELQDLNSLFQRFGRCNRKGVKEIIQPNCFVYTEINPGLLSGSSSFIDPCIYELSKSALLDSEKKLEGIITERQKIELIDQYFTTEKLAKSNFMIQYREIYNYITRLGVYEELKEDVQLRNILSKDIIPYSIYEKNKEHIETVLMELQNHNIGVIERLKLKESIKQYTVSIPYYVYKNNLKAINQNKAEYYGVVKLSQYEVIPIMDCIYKQLGFEEIEYKNRIFDPFIL